MTDLNAVLPTFSLTEAHARLLPALERAYITTTDLLTLDATDVAKRAQVPLKPLQSFCADVVAALHKDLGVSPSEPEPQHEPEPDAQRKTDGKRTTLRRTGRDLLHSWKTISTLDDALDQSLSGGIPTGYITEITGESGAGKTQLLLTLLLACQLPPPRGVGRSSLYISTEAALSTSRLAQLLRAHPVLQAAADQPSLDRVISILTPDLESQDHIIQYQLPVAVRRHNVGLVVLDSVAANYRAEFERPGALRNGANMAKRSAELVKLGQMLRDLARTEDLAIVVANQVADRFSDARPPAARPLPPPSRRSSSPAPTTTTTTTTHPNPPPPSPPDALPPTSTPATAEPLTLDHQQRWFTGWGADPRVTQLKTPSLGLVWTNQIACRVALLKSPAPRRVVRRAGDGGSVAAPSWRRWVNVVFAAWAPPSVGDTAVRTHGGEEGMLEFEITDAGLRVLGREGG